MTVLGVVLAVQVLVIGAVLGWAGAYKLFGRTVSEVASRSAIVAVAGEHRPGWKRLATYGFRVVGGIELVVATAVVLPPQNRVSAAAAVALAAGFLAYLWWARTVAPGSSCGCMSARRAPLTWRAFARAGFLLLAGVAALFATFSWVEVLGARPVSAAVLLGAELAAVVALSAEMDRAWLLPLRQLRTRLRHPLAGMPFEVPLESTLHQLRRSEAYGACGAALRSGVTETWDEGEWRILCYAAEYGGRRHTAVFAVPRLRYAPDEVRLAMVTEEDRPERVDEDRVAKTLPDVALTGRQHP